MWYEDQVDLLVLDGYVAEGSALSFQLRERVEYEWGYASHELSVVFLWCEACDVGAHPRLDEPVVPVEDGYVADSLV